jgi:Cu(I)-responsive transcriptional regulator
MNISAVADRAGLPAKTIRYYEEIGLVRPERQANNYRDYSDRDLHTLRFLQRARGLGFSIQACRALLALYVDRNRESADVRRLAESRIADIDRKIEELKSLRGTLSHLIAACHGDARPDCPILDDLAGERR